MSRRLHQPRRRSARSRGTARWAVGIFLMFTAVLAPVDATRLIDVADDFLGTSPAQAQTHGVFGGELAACNPGWTESADDESLCELAMPACPKPFVVPIDSTDPEVVVELSPFVRSIDYPGFCEALVLYDPLDTDMYDACATLGSLTGGKQGNGRTWAIVQIDPHVDCRMIVPAKCPDSDPDSNPTEDADRLNRVGGGEAGGDVCVAFQRRTWSCTDINGIPGNDGIPMNRFGDCYIERNPSSVPASHPACGGDVPAVPIISCSEYVANDYLEHPNLTPCGSFAYEFHEEAGTTTTVTTHSLSDFVTTPGHWCTYNPAHLDCHSDEVACADIDAHCIKRSVEGTGCGGIAAILLCRSLQFALEKGSRTIADLDTAGCLPCVVLPFLAAPDACPPTLREDPPASEDQYSEVHQLRADWRDPVTALNPSKPCVLYDIGDNRHPDYGKTNPVLFTCPWTNRCADPPHGEVTWAAGNSAGIALVGSRQVLRVEGLPTQLRTRNWATVIGTNLRLYGIGEMHYADDTIVRISLLTRNLGAPQRPTRVGQLAPLGVCIADDYPRFRVLVQGLWPDVDEAEIVELFGPDAIAWWTDLPDDDARRFATEAQGLMYVDVTDGLDNSERDELHRRASFLVEEAHCAVGVDVWCPWTPRRAGYHRLTAVGAWHLEVFHGHRQWLRGDGSVRTALGRVTSSGSCDHDLSDPRHDVIAAGRDYECILEHLGLETNGRTSAQIVADTLQIGDTIGVDIDTTLKTLTLRPLPSAVQSLPILDADQWLYSTAANDGSYACPPLKLRSTCGLRNTRSEAYNYTESAPIGIAVYEVRTVTRPSGN